MKMCNEVIEFELANIKLRLNGIEKEEIDFCNQLLTPCAMNKSYKTQYCYEYVDELRDIRRDKNPIELLNARYYIFDDICYVDFKKGGMAVWDISKDVFRYTKEKKSKNLRNWFFLHVIDPFSLVCIKESKLVVHGALWIKNGVGTIVCGESGSGKSTLSFLVKDELTVCCDDCVVLSYDERKVYASPVCSGFGIKKEMFQKYDITLDEDNILTKSKEKYYLKNIGRMNSLPDSIAVKNIFLLQMNKSQSTRIRRVNKSEAIRLFLDMQTNLPTTTFRVKYELMKNILESCCIYSVEYNDNCDVDVLIKHVSERG